MTSRAGISTSNFNKAYIAIAWNARHDLHEHEKRGFAQFFYLTMCGHIESVLSAIIKERMRSIRYMLPWNNLPPMRFEKDEATGRVPEYHSLKPLYESLLKIISVVESDTDNAPLGKLIELYNKVFQQTLKDVIGKDLYEDLDALASLRNLFAHGRDLFIEFTGSWNDDVKGTLDKNPLQKPAQRLHRAGIVKDFDITMQNYIDFHTYFYNDDALMYFYNSVKKIEERLATFVDFPPEVMSRHFMRLPDLENSSALEEG
jgi:hypothetical protein